MQNQKSVSFKVVAGVINLFFIFSQFSGMPLFAEPLTAKQTEELRPVISLAKAQASLEVINTVPELPNATESFIEKPLSLASVSDPQITILVTKPHRKSESSNNPDVFYNVEKGQMVLYIYKAKNQYEKRVLTLQDSNIRSNGDIQNFQVSDDGEFMVTLTALSAYGTKLEANSTETKKLITLDAKSQGSFVSVKVGSQEIVLSSSQKTNFYFDRTSMLSTGVRTTNTVSFLPVNALQASSNPNYYFSFLSSSLEQKTVTVFRKIGNYRFEEMAKVSVDFKALLHADISKDGKYVIFQSTAWSGGGEVSIHDLTTYSNQSVFAKYQTFDSLEYKNDELILKTTVGNQTQTVINLHDLEWRPMAGMTQARSNKDFYFASDAQGNVVIYKRNGAGGFEKIQEQTFKEPFVKANFDVSADGKFFTLGVRVRNVWDWDHPFIDYNSVAMLDGNAVSKKWVMDSNRGQFQGAEFLSDKILFHTSEESIEVDPVALKEVYHPVREYLIQLSGFSKLAELSSGRFMLFTDSGEQRAINSDGLIEFSGRSTFKSNALRIIKDEQGILKHFEWFPVRYSVMDPLVKSILYPELIDDHYEIRKEEVYDNNPNNSGALLETRLWDPKTGILKSIDARSGQVTETVVQNKIEDGKVTSEFDGGWDPLRMAFQNKALFTVGKDAAGKMLSVSVLNDKNQKLTVLARGELDLVQVDWTKNLNHTREEFLKALNDDLLVHDTDRPISDSAIPADSSFPYSFSYYLENANSKDVFSLDRLRVRVSNQLTDIATLKPKISSDGKLFLTSPAPQGNLQEFELIPSAEGFTLKKISSQAIAEFTIDFQSPLHVSLFQDGSYQVVVDGQSYLSHSSGMIELPNGNDLKMIFSENQPQKILVSNSTGTATIDLENIGNFRIQKITLSDQLGKIQFENTFNFNGGVHTLILYGPDGKVTQKIVEYGYRSENLSVLVPSLLSSNIFSYAFLNRPFIRVDYAGDALDRITHYTADGKIYSYFQIGALDLSMQITDFSKMGAKTIEALRRLTQDDQWVFLTQNFSHIEDLYDFSLSEVKLNEIRFTYSQSSARVQDNGRLVAEFSSVWNPVSNAYETRHYDLSIDPQGLLIFGDAVSYLSETKVDLQGGLKLQLLKGGIEFRIFQGDQLLKSDQSGIITFQDGSKIRAEWSKDHKLETLVILGEKQLETRVLFELGKDGIYRVVETQTYDQKAFLIERQFFNYQDGAFFDEKLDSNGNQELATFQILKERNGLSNHLGIQDGKVVPMSLEFHDLYLVMNYKSGVLSDIKHYEGSETYQVLTRGSLDVADFDLIEIQNRTVEELKRSIGNEWLIHMGEKLITDAGVSYVATEIKGNQLGIRRLSSSGGILPTIYWTEAFSDENALTIKLPVANGKTETYQIFLEDNGNLRLQLFKP